MERQLLLLGMLLNENMHGYQLNEQIDHSLGFFTDLKKSTLYYTLDKLEKEGYVRQETEREGNRPERRVYEVTDQGRAYFFDLLRRHLSAYTPAQYADDIAISFMDFLPPTEARDLLRQKRDQSQAALEALRIFPPHGGSAGYVVTHHIVHLEAEIAWLDGILQDME